MKISIYLAVLVLLGAAVVLCMPNQEDEDSAEAGKPECHEEDSDNAPDDDDDDEEEDSHRKKRRTRWNTVPGTSGGEGKASAPSGKYHKAGGCSSKYRRLKNSTMCAFKDSKDVTLWGCTSAEKREIIAYHNKIRAAEGAADMLKVYWSNDIAEIAQKLAQSCIYKHDTFVNRWVPGYNYGCGQNLCKGTGKCSTCMKMWADEKRSWTFGRRNSLSRVGHFSQMVCAKTVRIGCGKAYCNNRVGWLMVCNYSYAQNTGDVNTPYAKGRSCSKCGGKCRSGLCDCGNKYCNNGGTLDSANCKCKCKRGFSGSRC